MRTKPAVPALVLLMSLRAAHAAAIVIGHAVAAPEPGTFALVALVLAAIAVRASFYRK
jgi:hypothetical protein